MTGNAFKRSEIYVVEDDVDVRGVLRLMLTRAGYSVSCFADGRSLMDAVRSNPAVCILLDIHLPGPSGIEILGRLKDAGILAPVIIVSGNQDISLVVEALKLGAVDYVEKPFSRDVLVTRVEAAIRTSCKAENPFEAPTHLAGGKLTQRERQVLEHVVAGKSAKQVATELGLSSRTIEDHRANLLRKAGARNLAELVLKVMTAGPSVRS